MGAGVPRGCETSVLKVLYDPKERSGGVSLLKQEDALSDSLKCLPTRRVVAGREDCVSKCLKNVQRCALKCGEGHAECEFCRGEWTSGIPQGLSLPVSLVGLPSWYWWGSIGMPLSPSTGAGTAARAEQSPQRSKKPAVRRGKEAKRERSLSGVGVEPTPPRETAT